MLPSDQRHLWLCNFDPLWMSLVHTMKSSISITSSVQKLIFWLKRICWFFWKLNTLYDAHYCWNVSMSMMHFLSYNFACISLALYLLYNCHSNIKFEQVSDLGARALAISLPFSCVLGLLSSMIASTMGNIFFYLLLIIAYQVLCFVTLIW